MRCAELMKINVRCARHDDPVAEVAATMRDHNIGFVPVCDDTGHVVGTVTDRDLTIRILAERRSLSSPVREVMSTPIVTCKATDDLRTAERLMAEYRKSRILVVDDADKPVGVISLSDMADNEGGMRAGAILRSVAQRETRARP